MRINREAWLCIAFALISQGLWIAERLYFRRAFNANVLGAVNLHVYIFSAMAVLLIAVQNFKAEKTYAKAVAARVSGFLGRFEGIPLRRYFFALLFLVPLLKFCCFKFNFTPTYMQVDQLVEPMYFDSNFASDVNDSPLYSWFVLGVYRLFSPQAKWVVVLIQALMGCTLSILNFFLLVKIFKQPRAIALFISLCLATFAPYAIWEAGGKYDIWYDFFQLLFLGGMIVLTFTRNLKWLWLVFPAGLIFFLSKETTLLWAPFYAAWFGLIYWKDLKRPKKILKPLLIVALFLAPILIWNQARDAFNRKHFGTVSNRRDMNLALIVFLHGFLDVPAPTRYPLLKKELTDRYLAVIPEKMRKDTLILRHYRYAPYNQLSREFTMERDSEGKYISRHVPLFFELLEQNKWDFIKGSWVKFLGLTGWLDAFYNESRLTWPLWGTEWLHAVYRDLNNNYALWSLFLIAWVILFERQRLTRWHVAFLSGYYVFCGFFWATVTIGEYYRFLLPCQFIFWNLLCFSFVYYFKKVKALAST